MLSVRKGNRLLTAISATLAGYPIRWEKGSEKAGLSYSYDIELPQIVRERKHKSNLASPEPVHGGSLEASRPPQVADAVFGKVVASPTHKTGMCYGRPFRAFTAEISEALIVPEALRSNMKLELSVTWPARALIALRSPAFIVLLPSTSPANRVT